MSNLAPVAPAVPAPPGAPLDRALVPAPPGLRAGVYLVDLAVSLLLAGAARVLSGSWWVAAIVLVEAGLVSSFVRACTGRTLGALATRTVTCASGTDHAPGLARQAGRSALMGALHLSVVGPLVTVCTSKDGRDWVDRLCGTRALALRPALQRVTTVDDYGRPTLGGSVRAVAAGASPRSGRHAAPAGPPSPVARQAEPGHAPPGHAPPGHAPLSPAPPSPAPSAPVPTGPAADQRNVSPMGRPEPLPSGRVPGRAPVQVPTLVADTGQRVGVHGVLVVGRSPEADAAAGEQALALPDPTRSMSRTHLRVMLTASGDLVAEDAFSANGTVVQQPDGSVVEAPGGRGVVVRPGAVIRIGERSLRLEG